MAVIAIEKYGLIWSKENGPAFRLKLTGFEQWTDWIKVSSEEFMILGYLFKIEPLYFNQELRAIQTGPETPTE